MIAEAISKIQDLARDAMRPSQQEIANRKFLFQPENDNYEEIVPRIPKPRSAALGTVEALADWLRRYALPEEAFVIVSPTKGISARLDVEVLDYQAEEVEVPLFREDQPPTGWMGYAELLTYLDQHIGYVEEEERLRIAVKSLRVFKAREATLTEVGPAVNIAIKDSRGVCDEVQLPKTCTINLRVLTREYVEPHKFRFDLRVMDDASVQFRFLPMHRDEAAVHAVSRALADLRKLLGEGWLIVEGA